MADLVYLWPNPAETSPIYDEHGDLFPSGGAYCPWIPETEYYYNLTLAGELLTFLEGGSTGGPVIPGGGGGASDTAAYVILSPNGTLPNARTLAAGTGITITDGGPGGSVTIASTASAPVTSVFGRTGVVVAAAADYDASQVDNDSSVPGTFVDDALDNLAAVDATKAPIGRSIIAGAGLTGGGDLNADRTLNVAANADGSIVVNANDVQVGVLATDAQHGARGGGTQHAVAVADGAAGFMSGADKAKLDGLSAVPLSDADPLALGTADPGVATDVSRADHVHPMPAASDIETSGEGGSVQVYLDGLNTDLGALTTNVTDLDAELIDHVGAGGAAHADVVAGGASGFMTGTQATKLNGLPSSVPSISQVRLASDVTTTSTSQADVTGLSFAVTAGVRYRFRFNVLLTSSNAATGVTLSVNGPTATTIVFRTEVPTTNVAASIRNGTAFNDPCTTTAFPDATNDYMATVEGIFVPFGSGTLIVRFAAQTGGTTVTVKAGSYGELTVIP